MHTEKLLDAVNSLYPKLKTSLVFCIFCQANDARWEMYEKEKECNDLKQEVMFVKKALKHANDQCVLLFNEVQKAWKVSFTIQSDLKVYSKVNCQLCTFIHKYLSSLNFLVLPKHHHFFFPLKKAND